MVHTSENPLKYNNQKKSTNHDSYKKEKYSQERKHHKVAVTGTIVIICVLIIIMFNISKLIKFEYYDIPQLSLITLSQNDTLTPLPVKKVYGQTTSNLTETMIAADNKSEQSSFDLSQFIGLAPVIVAIVGISSGIATWATHYYQKKQYKLNALIGAFEQLNDLEHRHARSKIYEIFTAWGGANRYLSELNQFSDCVELVKADFDQIGSLIKNKLVDKQVFLDVYGTTIINYWQYLRDEIEGQKNARKDQLYMKNFKWLVDEANGIVTTKPPEE